MYHIGVDLSLTENVPEAVNEIRKLIGERSLEGPIVLINNAGFGTYGHFEDADVKEQASMVGLNCTAPVVLTHELLPLLKEHGGAVVNVASTASFQPTPFLATYGATKAFLMHWSLALNEELKGTEVGCLVVCPGPTSTAFFRRAGFAESPQAMGGHTVDYVVEVSLKALESGKALVVVGYRNRLMAFFCGRLPRVWVTRVAGLVLRKLRLERFLAQRKGEAISKEKEGGDA